MPALSAGVLLFRRGQAHLEVLLVHPGGPLWRKKDTGAWQIPKGMIEPGEVAATTARCETEEKLGVKLDGTPWPLVRIRQAGGKVVEAFALEQAIDADAIVSNEFEMEWPPHSGTRARFPEVDRAAWFGFDDATAMILPSQLPLLEALGAAILAAKEKR